MNVETLLSRLDGVQRSGNGWRAFCPCDHKRPSRDVAIAEGDGGMILLHAFCSHEAADVLGAVGLQLADLYPERIKDTSPEGRRAAREAFKRSAWSAALPVLAREGYVVLLAARDVLGGKTMPAPDVDRLAVAYDRIQQAREVLA